VLVCVCVSFCPMAGKGKAASSGRWRRRRSQDTMVKPTAQEPRSSADGGPAPRRRRSERGSLHSTTSLALPRRAARYAGPPRDRGRRADVRAAVVGSAGEARRSAQAPGGGRSERSEVEDAIGRVGSSLPSSGALRKPAAGGPMGELVVVVPPSSPSRPRRPALALQAFLESLARLSRMPRAF